MRTHRWKIKRITCPLILMVLIYIWNIRVRRRSSLGSFSSLSGSHCTSSSRLVPFSLSSRASDPFTSSGKGLGARILLVSGDTFELGIGWDKERSFNFWSSATNRTVVYITPIVHVMEVRMATTSSSLPGCSSLFSTWGSFNCWRSFNINLCILRLPLLFRYPWIPSIFRWSHLLFLMIPKHTKVSMILSNNLNPSLYTLYLFPIILYRIRCIGVLLLQPTCSCCP